MAQRQTQFGELQNLQQHDSFGPSHVTDDQTLLAPASASGTWSRARRSTLWSPLRFDIDRMATCGYFAIS